jgi:hypothetical protein
MSGDATSTDFEEFSEAAINRLDGSEQAPLNQILGYSDLVAIVLERLAAQELLGFACAPGDRRYAAHHHARVANGSAAALDDGRDGNDGVAQASRSRTFVVETLATGLGRGHDDSVTISPQVRIFSRL